MFEFKLPDLGEGIHEGELLAWHVKPGGPVKEDEPLCDVETDKATVTIPSPRSGVIRKLNAGPGDTIHVGHVIVVIEEEGFDQQDSHEQQGNITSAADALESDSKNGSSGQDKKEISGPQNTGDNNKNPQQKVPAAPATRRLAREMGLDINLVTGTGPGGRGTPEDLKTFQEPPEQLSSDSGPNSISDSKSHIISDTHPVPEVYSGSGIPFFEVAELPDYEETGPVERIPVRSIRKKVAVKTTSSMILVPHVAHMEECDVADLEQFRKEFNLSRKKEDRLTLMAFVIRALASLLKKYPAFNATLDPGRMEIIHKKYYHIGFAADTPKGLMIPVIRDASDKNISVIGREIRHLAGKGRDGSISVPELTGGTFSVTNVGSIGGIGVVPTINYPESAILGMGKVRKKPVVINDEIVAREILPVTLCFDHRIADGAQAARFVNDLKRMLENISVFLTEL